MIFNLFKKKENINKHKEVNENKTDAIANPSNDLSVESTTIINEQLQSQDQIKPTGFFKRMRNGLSKTRKILTTDIDELFTGGRKIDDALLEELEELLITSDIGVKTTLELIEHISKRSSKITDAKQLKNQLKEKILTYLNLQPRIKNKIKSIPHVILVIGVNGVGKTTTIGKLAARYSSLGKKVLIVAGDTFRAAATEQLTIWAERSGAGIVRHKENSDPAAVAFDGMQAALARKIDIVLIDTAGRLHTKTNLMEELKKIKRSVSKQIPDAPHETLLVLDATTGQNAISQTKLFNEEIDVTGIALTKLDGTAKGGVVVSICSSQQIPLKYIGIGEQINDLYDFDPETFVAALF